MRLFQVSANTDGSSMSGYLERTKASRKQWKQFWFVIMNKVLYTYAASEVRLYKQGHLNEVNSLV